MGEGETKAEEEEAPGEAETPNGPIDSSRIRCRGRGELNRRIGRRVQLLRNG